MPKNKKLDELVQLDLKRMEALLAWTEIIPNISNEEKIELLKFGERFGREAMVRRAESIVLKRNLVPKSYISTIKSKLDFLTGMHSIWRSGKQVKMAPLSVRLKQEKRKKFAEGFAPHAEPLVRSLLTLAFTKKVLDVYLTKKEISELVGVNASPANRMKLKALVERRTGQTISQLMAPIQRQVEQDFAQMCIENLKDGQVLTQNPDFAKEYQEIMESGNVAKLAAFYMKGKQ